MLQLNQVSKTYSSKASSVQALNAVSLELMPGEFVAVRGASGSGKSTLLLTAGGLLQPDSGDVLINGQNPYELSADERARFNREHHVPSQLSSGERQRTALARALLNEPSLLLADEPTGNLDQENAEAVLRHLKEFAESGGAVLLVTHDDRATPYAQRVIELQQGRVANPAEHPATA